MNKASKNFCIIGQGPASDLLATALRDLDGLNIEYIHTNGRKSDDGKHPVIVDMEVSAIGELEDYLSGHEGILISAQNPFIFTKSFLKDHRVLNIHFSKLPYFRGLFPIPNAMRHAPSLGGITLHEVVPAIDAGKVLAQLPIDLTHSSSIEAYYSSCIAATDIIFTHFALSQRSYDQQDKPTVNEETALKYFRQDSINFSKTTFELEELTPQTLREIKSLI